MVTAGLKCAPDTCPTAYAIVITVSPNARATPRKPMPSCTDWPDGTSGARYFAAKTALPQPPKTSQKVPSASAPSRDGSGGVRIGRSWVHGGASEAPRVVPWWRHRATGARPVRGRWGGGMDVFSSVRTRWDSAVRLHESGNAHDPGNAHHPT